MEVNAGAYSQGEGNGASVFLLAKWADRSAVMRTASHIWLPLTLSVSPSRTASGHRIVPCLAPEDGDDFDVCGINELVDRRYGFDFVAAINEMPRIARQSRRIA
ncbi:hypothetical protein Hden_1973 [Hyphomicrobium denitrificans ATCC 51888]|uniref:Uncharacterized protein n=1 Tax=Hyphomicrobium denitrificans (strain ATCC 51888 / DSM 1869 / NCIMB 11706 / TK 0415) TaxID=582899 RepID=D8JPP0_HYPDA|nr:hypothetical protein Hden_1973 [Hyphomicrobium denitrificans ATCC 51888]